MSAFGPPAELTNEWSERTSTPCNKPEDTSIPIIPPTKPSNTEQPQRNASPNPQPSSNPQPSPNPTPQTVTPSSYY